MRVDGNIHYGEQTITAGELGLAVHGVLKRTDPHCDQPFALASQGNFDGKGVHTGVRKDDQDLACSSVEATHQGCTRSEEHTSELQSPTNLVCRLLLEKKK